MEVKIKTKSEEETLNLGKKFAKVIKNGDIIAMFGELGSGKTAFVRGVAGEFGCAENVSSPTFAIVNEYNGKIKIYHFDMYRIHGEDELYCTGFYDYIEEENTISFIEWSENIEEALPEGVIKIYIKKQGENERLFTFEGIDKI